MAYHEALTTAGASPLTSCPKCSATYPADFTHCPKDGSRLSQFGLWTPGSVILGKYQLIEAIGTGGMATVYKARHIHFSEFRALKVIDSELGADPTFVRRFMQEAFLTRRLQHPNIVKVDDIETAEDGRPFMVMELVGGILLTEMLKGGALPLDNVLSIVRQAAAALGAAHDLGMVHRDIKPANLVLQPGPNGGIHLKVLDFGIAKVRETHLDEMRNGYLTLSGEDVIVGTPAYMSPEQAMGKRDQDIDGRADLYSLGTVMYQMLTGRLPISAASNLQFLLEQINKPPIPIRDVRPDLPDHVCSLVMSCLAKDRNQRPQTCAEFIAALDVAEWYYRSADSSTPPSQRTITQERIPKPNAPIIPEDQKTNLYSVTPQSLPTVVMSQAAEDLAPAASAPPSTNQPAGQPWNRTPILVAAIAVALLGLIFAMARFESNRPSTPVSAPQPTAASQTVTTGAKSGIGAKELPSEPALPIAVPQTLPAQLPAAAPVTPPPQPSQSKPAAPLKAASPLAQSPAASHPNLAVTPPVIAPADDARTDSSLLPPLANVPPPAPPVPAVASASHNTTFPLGASVNLQGVILSRDAHSLRVRNSADLIALVELSDNTRIAAKSSFVFHKNQFTIDDLMSGHHISVQGKGAAQGSLLAEKITFDDVVSLEGNWAYQSSKDPAESMNLRFTKQGASFAGHLTGRLKLAGASHSVSDVSLDLQSGEPGSNRFTWITSDGGQGILSVRLAEANKIRVDWHATKSSNQNLAPGSATLSRQ